jgi:hypothetical protein
VVQAFVIPTTESIQAGPSPAAAQTPPVTVFEEVTSG